MRFTKAVLLLSALIGGGTAAEAATPIELSRERFANSKAIGPPTFTSALSQPVEETIDLHLISASILHRPGP
jgi:hypothetical protein